VNTPHSFAAMAICALQIRAWEDVYLPLLIAMMVILVRMISAAMECAPINQLTATTSIFAPLTHVLTEFASTL
jgi:hypothetical protein